MTVSKQFAALLSILLGIVLTAIKFSIAIVTGSLSVLAEAVDAILDLVATGVTFLAVRVADLPPDDDHPYGHARADHLGALAETVLLVAAALWIGRQALERIIWSPVRPDINLAVFLVIAASLIINLVRVQILNRATAQSQSQALQASALNFSTDMIGSLVVLVAMAVVLLATWLPIPEWLVLRADAFAALCVALLALYLAGGPGVAGGAGADGRRAARPEPPPDPPHSRPAGSGAR
ncbi:MAG: cation diffusion facilitator family transporter [Chloroflexaceae bacterium]|nr:cation diffusion facilitator family transporter [Chloroflexaceae bacterium]